MCAVVPQSTVLHKPPSSLPPAPLTAPPGGRTPTERHTHSTVVPPLHHCIYSFVILSPLLRSHREVATKWLYIQAFVTKELKKTLLMKQKLGHSSWPFSSGSAGVGTAGWAWMYFRIVDLFPSTSFAKSALLKAFTPLSRALLHKFLSLLQKGNHREREKIYLSRRKLCPLPSIWTFFRVTLMAEM